jgi:hypothetical protein
MLPVSLRAWVCRGCAVLSVAVATSIPIRAETPLVSLGATQSIHFSEELWPRIEAMLETSATFRQQYQRILETPRLVLTARLDVSMVGRQFRARSSIRRYDSGLLVATIAIGPTSDPFEMLAHEFEHVLEQLEGVNVRSSADRGSGAWYSHGGMIETDRAVRAGRLVKAELRHVTRKPDILVERR